MSLDRICPNTPCGASGISIDNLGGGTAGKNRYKCLKCMTKWQENNPKTKMISGERDCRLSKGISKRTYICGICGLPKKGHTCPGKMDPELQFQNTSKRVQQTSDDDDDMVFSMPLFAVQADSAVKPSY